MQQQTTTGTCVERMPAYPGKQPSLVAVRAASVWRAFKNGGFSEGPVPYAVLSKMVDHPKTFEVNFKKLTNERQAEFKKFFWESANKRSEGEVFTMNMDYAVVTMRNNGAAKQTPVAAAAQHTSC